MVLYLFTLWDTISVEGRGKGHYSPYSVNNRVRREILSYPKSYKKPGNIYLWGVTDPRRRGSGQVLWSQDYNLVSPPPVHPKSEDPGPYLKPMIELLRLSGTRKTCSAF